jgi:DNA polymerase I-like protein with 3'-5' exonuclease and polymerase domains
VTWESDEQEMKAMLKEGRDPYVETAREFYKDPTIKKTREDGSEHPKYRTFKSFAHGTHYLGTPHGLAGRLGLTVHQAERTQQWYFQRFPRIREWQKEFCAGLASRRYVQNIFGYRRYYFGRIDEATMREAIAWLPQSTVALYINRIWMNIHEQYKYIWILLQVHDSLVGQFPAHMETQAMKDLEAASQIVLPYDDPLIIPTGTKTSRKSWGDC